MRAAWACEGATWGPRRRAASMIEDGWTGVGKGPRVPMLDGMTWRSVQWCSGSPLRGFDVVAGDPSVAVLAEPEALVVSVTIAGQDTRPSCASMRVADLLWDAEAHPLHPWAGRLLPSRGEVRERFRRDGWRGEPLVVVLAPSWTRATLSTLVASHASPAHRVVLTTSPEDFVGGDFVVCSGGWAPVWEARWSKVPFAAVHHGERDQDHRATCMPRDLPGLLAGVVPIDLPDDHRPLAPDYRPQFRSAISDALSVTA